MYAVARHGGQAPWWVLILEMAEAWGIPPWEVESGGSEWATYFQAWRKAKHRASSVGSGKGKH